MLTKALKTIKENTLDVICVQPVADILSLAFQSSYVTNEKNGVSIILVANAESAKTTIAHNYASLPFVTYHDDVTQKTLVEEFLPSIRNDGKKTLIIPDLINSVEKQKVTRNGFLNLLKSGMDDTGITSMNTLHLKLKANVDFSGTKFNVITAITSKALIQGSQFEISLKKSMINSGLMTRFLPFSYNYPPLTTKKIREQIHGLPIDNNDKVKFPSIVQKPRIIEDTPTMISQLDNLATAINAEMEFAGYGFRALILLRRLAKANALINNRNKLNQEDIDKVLSLGRFINFKCGDI